MDARYPGAFGDVVREAVAVAHIVIVGPMGVGKSTLGRALAVELGRPYHDSDDDLLADYGTSGADHAAVHGHDALWALEAELLISRLAEQRESVITAAGSVVDDGPGRTALAARAFVIWLDAPPELVCGRAEEGDHRRPMKLDEAVTLDVRRRPHYEALADLRIDASQSSAVVLHDAVLGVTV